MRFIVAIDATRSFSAMVMSRTLRVAADARDFIDGGADDDALGGDEHELLILAYDADADDGTGLLGDLHVDEALAAAGLRAVFPPLRCACRSRPR